MFEMNIVTLKEKLNSLNLHSVEVHYAFRVVVTSCDGHVGVFLFRDILRVVEMYITRFSEPQ